MRRYMRFFPIILAALALATSGSNIILLNASAQLGATQKVDRQKGGDAATLSVAAQQQISALLQEKYSRTREQKKISSHLLYAMRAQRGQAMTSRGEVRTLNSAMSVAKSVSGGRVPVIIRAAASRRQQAVTHDYREARRNSQLHFGKGGGDPRSHAARLIGSAGE